LHPHFLLLSFSRIELLYKWPILPLESKTQVHIGVFCISVPQKHSVLVQPKALYFRFQVLVQKIFDIVRRTFALKTQLL